MDLPFANGGFDVATMALVIAFVPDPAKAVAELRRVVAPGGIAASYMWDLPGGLPLAPLFKAMTAMGHPPQYPPSASVSQMEAMTALWRNAGLLSVESTVVRITVRFDDFDDLWTSFTLPVGPQAKAVLDLNQAERQILKDTLQPMLPAGPDGSISYESFANAVKGRCP